jgi:hypothetical protein
VTFSLKDNKPVRSFFLSTDSNNYYRTFKKLEWNNKDLYTEIQTKFVNDNYCDYCFFAWDEGGNGLVMATKTSGTYKKFDVFNKSLTWLGNFEVQIDAMQGYDISKSKENENEYFIYFVFNGEVIDKMRKKIIIQKYRYKISSNPDDKYERLQPEKNFTIDLTGYLDSKNLKSLEPEGLSFYDGKLYTTIQYSINKKYYADILEISDV